MRAIAILLSVIAVASGTHASPPESPAECQPTATQFFSLLDRSAFGDIHSLFAAPAGWEHYLSTYYKIVVREYGYPSEVTLDSSVDPTKYTEMAMGPKDLEPPFKTFHYRTLFSHEGPGLILIQTQIHEGSCKIGKVVFGLPKSRPDAMRRFYEIAQQIDAEFAATLGD